MGIIVKIQKNTFRLTQPTTRQNVRIDETVFFILDPAVNSNPSILHLFLWDTINKFDGHISFAASLDHSEFLTVDDIAGIFQSIFINGFVGFSDGELDGTSSHVDISSDNSFWSDGSEQR